MNCLETVIFAILEVALRSLRNAYSFVGNSRQIGSTLVVLGKKTTSRARPCLAVALSIVLIMCFTSLVTTPFVQAADPGHAASRISAGTFEAGNFVFPNNLTITDFLIVNTNTLYVDVINGRAGVGTTSPSANLNVKGTLNTALTGTFNTSDISAVANTSDDLTSEISAGDAIKIVNASDSSDSEVFTVSAVTSANITLDSTPGKNWTDALGYKDSGLFRVDDGDATGKFIVDKSGDIGIGTTNPDRKLEVSIDDNAYAMPLKLTNINAGGTAYSGFESEINGVVLNQYITTGSGSTSIRNINNQPMYLYVNNTDTKGITIYTDGQVGINDTTPSYTLDVNGTIRATSDILIDTTSVCQSDGTNCPSGMANSSAWNHSGTNVFLANSGDSVGIGTASPSTKLDVNGSLRVDNATGSAVLFVNTTSGRVGMGTANPGYELEVFGSILGHTSVLSYYHQSSDDAFRTYPSHHTSSNALIVYGNNGASSYVERMRILASGDVGIGTTSPGNELEVNGTINATAIKVGTTNVCQSDGTNCPSGMANSSAWNKSGSNVFLANPGDSVGIGTDSPSQLLHLDSTSNTTQIIEAAPNNDSTLKLLEQGTGDVGAYLKYDGDNNRFGIWVGNDPPTEKLTILRDSNYVGIGTASPGAKLHVYDSSTAGIIIDGASSHLTLNKSAAGTKAEIRYLTAGADTWYAGVSDSGDAGSGNEYFIGESAGGASAAFWIEPTSGNVGIGTTSPVSLLTVGNTSTTTAELTIQGEYQSSGFTNNDILNFRHGGNNRWRLRTDQNSAASNNFDLVFSALNASATGYEDFVVFEGLTGEVGIGTAGPNYKLDVNGTSNFENTMTFDGDSTANGIISFDASAFIVKAQNNMDLELYDDSNNGIIVKDGGDVGIGTAGPLADLDIKSDSAGGDMLRLSHSGSPTAAGIIMRFSNDETVFLIEREYGDTIYDGISMVRETGNVGIGDVSPDAPLEINSTTTPQFMISHTDGVDYANFTVDSDGNLTISASSGNVFIQLG